MKEKSEVLCQGKPISKAQKLKGTGILQLPNGCTLQVIDKDGRVTKLKGQPQNTVITASDIRLMPEGPLSAVYANVDTNHTNKVSAVNAYMEARVSSVIKQVLEKLFVTTYNRNFYTGQDLTKLKFI